ncbi:MAG: ABC transporter ATP-binding protein [Deltaproteobacteria bacterium]|nr:ABC transporter ATP-binding protein [Deltaproteobacteria bacterium]MBM4323478.1 ABC transporter ATP-binding protein [Deltaproteobacteria bacterium]
MLEVKQISVSYGLAPALWEVSLSVKDGNIVVIVGSNGAGKSTLMKTISGLIHPGEGTIEFDQRRIDHLPPHQIARMGIAHVPEGRRIFPHLTVIENLKMGVLPIKGQKRAQEILNNVFNLFPILAERQRQLGGTLSGGQQQMLAVGRGLMSDPKILLLDEPSLGLAPIIVDMVFEVVARLNSQGQTILLVEQNAFLSLEVAQYAYVLEVGRIVLEGEASKLIDDPHIKKAYLGK